jgi:hypothetical protein
VRIDGLTTYISVIAAPRRAFTHLADAPTWGWAAVGGILLTLAALLISEPAQLHMLAVSEAHRVATMPASDRLREHIASAQVAPYVRSLFIFGAMATPWIAWALIASFLFVAAAIGRGRLSFGAAWVAALNSYAVYGVAGVVNSILVALRDPSTMNAALDLVRLPSVGWLFPHNPALGAFFSAYNVLSIWYYAVVAIALQRLMRVQPAAAATAAFVYSLLCGLFAAAGAHGGP